MRVTIKDIARKAGVSITTVSKALNNYSDVNEKTKLKILEIVKELNYSPNIAARTLSSKKKKRIALILNEINLNRKSPIVMEILSGVYNFTEQNDIEFVLLFTTKQKQYLNSFEAICHEQNIHGAIIHGLDIDDPYCESIAKSDIPSVLIDLELHGKNTTTVTVDNEKAAEAAVNYLTQLGHKKIAHISGKYTAQVSIQRKAGYKKGLTNYGTEFIEDYIINGDFDEDLTYELTKKFVLKNPEVTAFFCSSDLMAIGAMRAIQDLGFSVPHDFSIFGFDNIILSGYVNPSITTISQDMESLGYKSTKLLWDKLSESEEINKLSQKIHMPYELIVRQSTRKCRTLTTNS